MTQELLQKLKSAGYPIRFNPAKWILDKPFAESEGLNPSNEHYGYEEPTLEKLIQECGMHFNYLERLEDNKWVADGFPNFDGDAPVKSYGANPKEAVGNLWLSFKKR